MLRLEKDGNRRAALVNRLLETRERMIGAILIGNNVVNIAASALATGLLLAWFGDVGVLYATVDHDGAGRGVRRSAAEDRWRSTRPTASRCWSRGRSPGWCGCSGRC